MRCGGTEFWNPAMHGGGALQPLHGAWGVSGQRHGDQRSHLQCGAERGSSGLLVETQRRQLQPCLPLSERLGHVHESFIVPGSNWDMRGMVNHESCMGGLHVDAVQRDLPVS